MVASNVHVSNLAYACKDKLDCRSQNESIHGKCVYLLHNIITKEFTQCHKEAHTHSEVQNK